ncbi:MAG: hypothetical protein IMW97_07165 [Firmicutes bacterium]|nr:hypothetical protein [Candidatus Fermentithermobacillaceae bacterium]
MNWGDLVKGSTLRLVLLGALGVLLIVAGSFMSSGRAARGEGDELLTSLLAYERGLAEEVARIVSSIEGVGRVAVSVKLEAGLEKETLWSTQLSRQSTVEKGQGTERQTSQENVSREMVSARLSGEESPFVPRTRLPKVAGVVVVAEGADDPRVKANIYKAVTTLLEVPAHKVEVLPMKGGR